MATTIYENCFHLLVDPTDEAKQIWGVNLTKVIHKDGHIYGCDRGCFVDDHCNSRCSYKELKKR
ncbi:hypothetical protein AGMMS49587_02780 [Spirochaetia bacterium]|nr:hypothetical protein AGMMS49587_02780 [Spirochaetia bacterium]